MPAKQNLLVLGAVLVSLLYVLVNDLALGKHAHELVSEPIQQLGHSLVDVSLCAGAAC